MIINDDSLHALKELEDNSIDLIATDPPYGYSFMGKDWDKAVPSVEIWKECLRVLKPGGWCMVMSAPRSDVLSRMIVNIEDAGFRVDFSPIVWTFASGFPKASNIHKNIAKQVDNITGVIYNNSIWKSLKNVSIAQSLFQSLKTEAGTHIDSNDFVVLNAQDYTEPSQKNTNANSAIKPSQDLRAILKGEFIVVKSVDILDEHLSLSVIIVQNENENQNVLREERITVPKSAITKVCEQALSRIKGVEALKIELGSLKSLDEQGISALCAELTENLRRTILSQYNSTLNSDTTSPTDCAYATNVITTEYTRECLTSSMVDILGNELREKSEHLKGSYGGAQMKPAVEVVIVAMKPLSEKTYVDQALKNGKGVTWLDDCRVPTESKLGRPQSSTSADNPYNKNLQNNGFNDASDKLGGRFPANLLVSDDVLNTHSKYFDLDAWADTLPFLAVPKASKSEKNKGLEGFEEKQMGRHQSSLDGGKMLTGSGNERSNTRKNHHPTVKPLKLMSYLITLGSRPGDTVLDPFVGSGTTVVAAKQLDRKGIGIEREPEYAEIAQARVDATEQRLRQGELL